MALFGKRRVVERVPPLRPRRNQPEQSRRTVSCQRALPEQCIEIPVPAIVQADLHDAVQAQLAENRKRHRRASADAQYLLQGLVVCKRCGFAMCGARNGNRLYYRCIGNGATRMTGVHVCQSRSIRGELLEQIVWDDARSLLEEPARVEAEYQRRLNLSAEQGRGPDDQKLRKQLNQARRQIGRLIDAYGDGLIDKAEFEPRIRAARDQVAKLETDIKSQAEQQQQIQELRLVIGHLQAFAERVHNGLDAVTTADRRQILRALIKRIEVDCEEVTIVYRIDCHPFPHAPERGCVQDCRRRPCDAEAPTRWAHEQCTDLRPQNRQLHLHALILPIV
jgi:site-specific DNA recombinase